jgi:hypothetical protein
MSADFEFEIKSTADLKAARELQQILKEQAEGLRKLGQDASVVEGALKKVSHAISEKKDGGFLEALKEHTKELLNEIPGFEKFAGVLTKLASGPLGLIAAGFALITAAAEAAKESITAFAGAEKQVTKLDAALAQTGQLTDENREKLQELADVLENATGKNSSEWIGAFARLIQFGGDVGKINDLAAGVENLAGILGGDIGDASNMLSRALQGNFEMFGRMGIHIDETGSKAEKFQKLLEQLAQVGGGQLRAANETLGGQWEKLKNSLDHLFTVTGNWIASLGLVQGAIKGTIFVLDQLSRVFPSLIPLVGNLKNALTETRHEFDNGADAAKYYAEELKGIAKLAEANATALQRQFEAQERLTRQQDEITDAQTAEKNAIIDRLEKQGKISPESAIAARAANRVQGEVRKAQRADATDAIKIAGNNDLIEKDNAQASEAQENVNNLESRIKERDAEATRRSASIKAANEAQAAAEKQLAAYQKAPWNYSNTELGIYSAGRPTVDSKDLAKLQRKVDEAKERVNATLEASRAQPLDMSLDEKKRKAQEVANQAVEKLYPETNRLMEENQRIESERRQRQRLLEIRTRTDVNKTASDIEEAKKNPADTSKVTFGVDAKGRVVPLAPGQKPQPIIPTPIDHIPDEAQRDIYGRKDPHLARIDLPPGTEDIYGLHNPPGFQGPPTARRHIDTPPTAHVEPGAFGKTGEDLQKATTETHSEMLSAMKVLIRVQQQTKGEVRDLRRDLDDLDKREGNNY